MRTGPDMETAPMREALEPTQDSDWTLSHEGYNVLTESAVESRLAFGNGFLGMRAARSRQIRAILRACQLRRGTPIFATPTTRPCELWLAFGNLNQLAQLRARQRHRDVFERDGVRHDVVQP